VSDLELKESYHIYLDGDGILNLVSLQIIREPKLSTRLAELICKDIIDLLDKDSHKEFDMLIDLLPVESKGYASSKARKLYA